MAERGINKVILVGNLGQAPEVRYMPNGGAVANLTLATSESWRDKVTGEACEKTEWHRVVLFGKLAEIAGEYLTKGSKIYVEGQLKTRKWQDAGGIDHYTTEIVINVGGTMQMLGSAQGNRPSGDAPVQSQTPANTPSHSGTAPAPAKTRRAAGKGKKAASSQPAQEQNPPQSAEYPPVDYDDSIPF